MREGEIGIEQFVNLPKIEMEIVLTGKIKLESDEDIVCK